MFDFAHLVRIVLLLLGGAAICWLLWWLIDYWKVQEPWNKIGKGIVATVAVLFLISIILNLMGQPGLISFGRF